MAHRLARLPPAVPDDTGARPDAYSHAHSRADSNTVSGPHCGAAAFAHTGAYPNSVTLAHSIAFAIPRADSGTNRVTHTSPNPYPCAHRAERPACRKRRRQLAGIRRRRHALQRVR
jgi:hypothetical protein